MLADKVLLAVPTRGAIHNQTISRLEAVRDRNPGLGPILYSAGHLSSHETREQAVQYFMQTSHDVLIMCDDDVIPPLDLLGITERMDDYDVIGCAVPMFQPKVAPIPLLMAWTYHPDRGDFSPLADGWGETGVVEIGGVGFGCVAIHRRVFEKMEAPYFPMEYDEVRTMTDDLSFCRRVLGMGMRVACDFDRYCEHNSTVPLLLLAQGMSDLIEKALAPKLASVPALAERICEVPECEEASIGRLTYDLHPSGEHVELKVCRYHAEHPPDTLEVLSVGMELNGRPVMQNPNDIAAWEAFFTDNSVESIMELGTGTGGMSDFLAGNAEFFTTFDHVEPAEETHGFVKADIYGENIAVYDEIAKAPRPLLLFCDGGDKPREVNMFAGQLKPGDYLAVHDFGREIHEADIPAFLTLVDIGPNDSLTRFYRR